MPNNLRSLAGCGLQTAAVAFGGRDSSYAYSDTYEYDGAAWSTMEYGDMVGWAYDHAGFGSQTAGVSCAGNDGVDYLHTTEEYILATYLICLRQYQIRSQLDSSDAGDIDHGFLWRLRFLMT